MADDVERVPAQQHLSAAEAGAGEALAGELVDRAAELGGGHLLARGVRDVAVGAPEVAAVGEDERHREGQRLALEERVPEARQLGREADEPDRIGHGAASPIA